MGDVIRRPSLWDQRLAEAQVRGAARIARERNYLRPVRTTRKATVLPELLPPPMASQTSRGQAEPQAPATGIIADPPADRDGGPHTAPVRRPGRPVDAACQFNLSVFGRRIGFVMVHQTAADFAVTLAVVAETGKLKVANPGRWIINRKAVRTTAQAWIDANRERILQLLPIGQPMVRFIGGVPFDPQTVRVQAYFLHLCCDVTVVVSFQDNLVTVTGIEPTLRGHTEIKRHFEKWGEAYRARLAGKARRFYGPR
jgi:hypothetical protein